MEMTRITSAAVLALALCTAPAMAEEWFSNLTDPGIIHDYPTVTIISPLQRAYNLCMAHNNTVPPTFSLMPPEWREPCLTILQKWNESGAQEAENRRAAKAADDARKREQRDLDFVRGVAGMKENTQ